MNHYVHFGCGLTVHPAWENYDASPTIRIRRWPIVGDWLARTGRIPDWSALVRYGDVVRGLPLPDDSCAGVYSSHVLEHLALEDCRVAIRNVWRLLRPGGVFRFVLPDLAVLIADYNQTPVRESAGATLIRDGMMGAERRVRGFSGLARAAFGNSAHLWLWDFEGLRAALAEAGFVSIRRATMGDSIDPRFSDLEEASRWNRCLGIECRKPIVDIST